MAHKALGAGVRIMFSSVGLVAESVHHLKEKYSKSPTVSGIDVTAIGADLLQSPDHAHAEEVAYDVPPLYQEGDEAQWQLDEAQDELILTSSEATLSEEEREKAVIERQKSEKYNEHNPKGCLASTSIQVLNLVSLIVDTVRHAPGIAVGAILQIAARILEAIDGRRIAN
ncbi:hypothetical protein BDZ45DRAFT_691199 [Acephala macrosclerotiorum]|nr:hypothetical protein BDZ45DRAFT_691199 [Acephala macrosclerotiorum]